MKIMVRIFLIIGCLLIFSPILKIMSMQIQSQRSLQHWNQSLELENKNSIPSSIQDTEVRLGEVIGTLSYSSQPMLAVIEGITPEELEKGLGHDPLSVLPGEIGNCLVYGHREQFLWHLQFIEVGDIIEIQMKSEMIQYKVDDILILNPTDTKVFEETDYPSLTLVTCYPFIYFGTTEERFVVKASLQQ